MQLQNETNGALLYTFRGSYCCSSCKFKLPVLDSKQGMPFMLVVNVVGGDTISHPQEKNNNTHCGNDCEIVQMSQLVNRNNVSVNRLLGCTERFHFYLSHECSGWLCMQFTSNLGSPVLCVWLY